jgi:acetyl esterase/lipase
MAPGRNSTPDATFPNRTERKLRPQMRIKLSMIDPELRALGFIIRVLNPPSLWLFRIAHRLGKRGIGKNIEGLECDERRIPAIDEGPPVRARIYRPIRGAGDARLPGVLFLHGGGYAIGNPEEFGDVYRMLIETRECVIVAPDYRKSLDAPYPAAVNDCYAALLFMKENAAELGIREDQLIVIGQSAGGGLTASISLMARDRGDVNIAFQLPLYPMIDDRMITESARDNNAPVWSSRHNRLGWDLYLGELSGDDVPTYAAPARETDLSNLPPTATFVGSLDPFRDETVNYVESLRAAGVPAAFREFKGCFHGFDLVAPKSRVAREAGEFLREQLSHAVDDCFAKQP